MRFFISILMVAFLAACGASSTTSSNTNSPGTGTPGTTGPTGPTAPTGVSKYALASANSEDGKVLCEKLGWTWDAVNNYCIAAVAKGLEGKKGEPGVRYRRAAYQAEQNAEIKAGDMVRGRSGAVFMAVIDTPTTTLPLNTPDQLANQDFVDDGSWALVVPRGLQGFTGQPGPAGPAGPAGGPAGPQGPPGLYYMAKVGTQVVGTVLGVETVNGSKFVTLAEVIDSKPRIVRRHYETSDVQHVNLYFKQADCGGDPYVFYTEVHGYVLDTAPMYNEGLWLLPLGNPAWERGEFLSQRPTTVTGSLPCTNTPTTLPMSVAVSKDTSGTVPTFNGQIELTVP